MSQRHHEALKSIRQEHDDVVAALTEGGRRKKRGAPGAPDFDPARLEKAIGTAADAYALLLIATAEGFLREYLQSIGLHQGEEPRLSTLIDQSFRELNQRSGRRQLLLRQRQDLHVLRINRNHYAHGHGIGAFPTVARVQDVLSRFLSPFPDE